VEDKVENEIDEKPLSGKVIGRARDDEKSPLKKGVKMRIRIS
jgi:hypothetical protein